jgi:hypothetical protein
VNSSDFQDFPDGGIVRGVAGGEYGVIFQETAMRRMTYAPGSPVHLQHRAAGEYAGVRDAVSGNAESPGTATSRASFIPRRRRWRMIG